jgi:hypothetical protein
MVRVRRRAEILGFIVLSIEFYALFWSTPPIRWMIGLFMAFLPVVAVVASFPEKQD